MKNTRTGWRVAVAFSAAALMVTAGAQAGQLDAMIRASDRLVADQENDGSWAGAEDFTGSITAGLLNAYRHTGDSSYLGAAQDAGDFIVDYASGNYLGDEAFALTQLSASAPDPAANAWRDEVSDFYSAVNSSSGGTGGYVNSLITNSDPSEATLYLASHTVAADYVQAQDRSVWRDGTVSALADVDNNSNFPVLGLGSAVWGLAQTGPLDNTLVDLGADSSSPWHNVSLADLPDLLADHQDGDGSFFYAFDSEAGDASGFTEDTAYAVLGLLAAQEADPSLDYSEEIGLARGLLADGIDEDGFVYEHLFTQDFTHPSYSGATLQTLVPEPSSMALLALGGCVMLRRRRRQRA